VANRQHVASLGIGVPGSLFVTMGLGRRLPFVPVLPDQECDLIGADDTEKALVGADDTEESLLGASDAEIGMVGADDTENPLDGGDPGPHNVVGTEECC
jgi:hypothetical protein